ncbi:hypothetical protein LCGC14_2587600 [marine sediment metagenome]|uniref:Uncharacterized protein n=1 Tax=marine sediment metagenome TaxID=412755 RepID=A0A0F9ACJ7_9ZZZZ
MGEDITISAAIAKLEQIAQEHGGDTKLHVEISVPDTCGGCGHDRSRIVTGMCKHISTINIYGEDKCAWLVAEEC